MTKHLLNWSSVIYHKVGHIANELAVSEDIRKENLIAGNLNSQLFMKSKLVEKSI